MHIVLFIIGILTALSVWAWRIRAARDGLDHAADVARTAVNLPRRFAFRYKAGRGGLDLIDDPREAAAIMMMEIARARGGPLTARQNDVIDAEIMQHFNFTAEETEELTSHAAWVTNHAPPPGETMRRLSKFIVSAPHLGPKEVIDLDAMLVAVTEAEGVPTQDQMSLLQVFRNVAGLKT